MSSRPDNRPLPCERHQIRKAVAVEVAHAEILVLMEAFVRCDDWRVEGAIAVAEATSMAVVSALSE